MLRLIISGARQSPVFYGPGADGQPNPDAAIIEKQTQWHSVVPILDWHPAHKPAIRLLLKIYPRNIDHMPAGKFFAEPDFDPIGLFPDRH